MRSSFKASFTAAFVTRSGACEFERLETPAAGSSANTTGAHTIAGSVAGRIWRFSLTLATTVLLLSQSATAGPTRATPADNDTLAPVITGAGLFHFGATVYDLYQPPGFNLLTFGLPFGANIALKNIPPVFAPPNYDNAEGTYAAIFKRPTDDSGSDACRFEYTDQRVSSRYKSIFVIPYMGLDNSDAPGEWGFLGEGAINRTFSGASTLNDGPGIYHNSSDVALTLDGLGTGVLNNGSIPGVASSDPSYFASGALSEGKYTLRWTAATQFSAALDVAAPLAFAALWSKINYAPHAKAGGAAVKALNNGGARAGQTAASKHAAGTLLREKRVQFAIETMVGLAGSELADQISTARADDPEGRFTIYDLLSIDAALNTAQQQLYIWDIHAPYFVCPESGQTIETQNVVLEAQDFGGIRFSRAQEQLLGTFAPRDDCNRPLTTIPVDPPTLLQIQDEPHEVVWYTQDEGPYNPHYWDGSRRANNQELFGQDGLRTRLTQYVTVRDTQAPLLVPPAGFAILSETPTVDSGDIDFGQPLVVDRADPHPVVTQNPAPPAELQRGFRYAIEYVASDFAGNQTEAPAEDPEQYTQIVSVKATNTPPDAVAPAPQICSGGTAAATACTRTSEPVEIELTGIDPDLLPMWNDQNDLRPDPLEFVIADRPQNGSFEAPLLPFFIEDFRLQPDEVPDGTTWEDLPCPEPDNEGNITGSAVEGRLGQLEVGVHNQYMRKCFCSLEPPKDFVYEPRYVHITDDDVYYVLDSHWQCEVDDPNADSRRISRWRDGALLGWMNLGVNSQVEIFDIDANETITWQRPTGNDRLEEELREIAGPSLPMDGQISGTSVILLGQDTRIYGDAARGVVYGIRGRRIELYEYENADPTDPVRIGAVTDASGNDMFMSSSGDCNNNPSTTYNVPTNPRGISFRPDSEGNLYITGCGHRLHKVGPPQIAEDGSISPGEYIGWLGSCTANLLDPDTGVAYNDCDEINQNSRGFQCTDQTCARAGSRTSGWVGSAAGHFNRPVHVNIDPNDIIYVADYENFRIQRFAPDGTFAGEARSDGDGAANGDFVLGNMGRPQHVSVNSDAFHVLEWNSENTNQGDYFLHIFKTLPFYDITDSSAKLKYVSNFGFRGRDTFDFLVDDGIEESAHETVSIQVDRAFNAPDAPTYTCYTSAQFDAETSCDGAEDEPLYLRVRARDIDGFVGNGGLDTLSFTVIEAPTHGSLEPLGAQADHQDYRYVPDPNYNGEDTFIVQAHDGLESSPATDVTVTLAPVYDPPELDIEQTYMVPRGFEHRFFIEYSDPDEDEDEELGLYNIHWGNSDPVAYIEEDGEWLNHGLHNQWDEPLDPVTQLTPGTGLIMFAHNWQDEPVPGSNNTARVLSLSHLGGQPGAPATTTTQAVVIVEQVTRIVPELIAPEVEVGPVDPFDIVLRVTNARPEGWAGFAATNVLVEFTIPAGMEVLGTQAPCGNQSGETVTCNIPFLGQGASVDLTLNTRVTLQSARDTGAWELHMRIVDDGPRLDESTAAMALFTVGDADGDGVIDYDDAFDHLEDYSVDSDGDGMADAWESMFGLDPSDASDASIDLDGDGLTNLQEFQVGNAPLLLEEDSLVGFGQRVFSQQEVRDEFGYNVQSGDLNGDGYSDVVIGAPQDHAASESPGAVFIGYGSPEGVGALQRLQPTGLGGFGYGLDVADYDNNGYADIAASDGQSIFLYMNGPAGLDPSPSVLPNTYANVIESADVDGDSQPDLLIGNQSYDSGLNNQGRVQIYLARWEYWNDPTQTAWINGGTAELRLGDTISATDLDQDGKPDLLIGAAAGNQVMVYLGDDNNWGNATPVRSFTIAGPDGGRFGQSLSTGGDVDGDGQDDLLVGAPQANATGSAYLYLSSDNFWEAAQPQPSQHLSGNSTDDDFGGRVALLPATSPYIYADAVIGAHRADSTGTQDSGAFTVFRGSPDGLVMLDAHFGDDRHMLGFYIADAGDVNGDGRNDVIVGAPEFTSPGYTQDGGYAEIYTAGGVPLEDDSDADRVGDGRDNCATLSNTNQADLDADGQGNVCDSDADGDGLPRVFEEANQLDDLNADDAHADLDGDTLTNLQEYNLGTNPRRRDTDGDGLGDNEELENGLDPLDPDDCPEFLCPRSSVVLKIITILNR